MQGSAISAQANQPRVYGTRSLVQKFLSGRQPKIPTRERFARLLITSREYHLNPEKALLFFAEEPDIKCMNGSSQQTAPIVLRKMANDFISQAPDGWRTLFRKGVVAPQGGSFFNDAAVAGIALSIIAKELGGVEKITGETLKLYYMDKALMRLAGEKCSIGEAIKKIPELIALAETAPKSQELFFDPALPLHHAVIKAAVLTGKFAIDASGGTFARLQEFAPIGESMKFHHRAAPMSRERLRDIARGMVESGDPKHLEELYGLYWSGKFKLMIDFRRPENRKLARQAWLNAMGETLPTEHECRHYLLPRFFAADAKRRSAQRTRAQDVSEKKPGKASPFFKAQLEPGKPAAKPAKQPAKPHKKRGRPPTKPAKAQGVPPVKQITPQMIHFRVLEKKRREKMAEAEAQRQARRKRSPQLCHLGWSPSEETPEKDRTVERDLHDTARKVKKYCCYSLLGAAAEMDVEVLVSVANDPAQPYIWESQPHLREHESWIVISYDGSESNCYYSFNGSGKKPFGIGKLDGVLDELMKLAGSAGKKFAPS
jgi:hypothetical protein